MFEGSKKAAPLVTRLIAVAAVPVLSLLALSLTPHPTDSDASAAYVEPAEPAAGDVTVLASEVFLTNASAQLLSRESGDLELAAGQSVTVDYQDSLVSAVSQEETVAELLARLEIQPSPLEMVSVSSQEDGVTITIDSELVFYENVSSVEEHEVIYQYNSQKPDWYESVIQEGSNGEYTEVYEVIYQDGAETSRHLVDVVEGNCRLKQALVRDKRFPELYLLPSAQTKDKSSVSPEQMKKLEGVRLPQSLDYAAISGLQTARNSHCTFTSRFFRFFPAAFSVSSTRKPAIRAIPAISAPFFQRLKGFE